MVDLLAIGASVLELTPPDHERLETADRLGVAVAGPESNAAVAASRLGTDCAWASKLPATPLGRRVVGELARHGVKTSVCWNEAGRQGLAFAERGGEPRGETRIPDRDGAVASMTPADLPVSGVEPSMVYTSAATAALSEPLAATTRHVFEERTAGTTTVLSVSRPRVIDSPAARETVASLLPATDVLFTTEAGAAAFEDRATPAQTVHGLAAAHDFETVVLAREERGAVVWHDRTVHEHGPPGIDAVDERGAFDALCGAFLARRFAGDPPDGALATGVACAALARTVPGPVPVVGRGELERCVDTMEANGTQSPP